ncbi:MAG: hypothetical protein JNL63_05290, partial [Bacteroidia bacterium]|nr:hypothetical protein [Bacteroidia bacterium]
MQYAFKAIFKQSRNPLPKWIRMCSALIMLLLCVNTSFSQDFLRVNLKFLIDGGNRDGAKITIQKDGSSWKA